MRGLAHSSRRGVSPAMIGRDGELRRLAQLAAAPGTGLAILAGEPGIGKTRLVRELLEVIAPNSTVLVGQAEPGSLGRPFELLLSAVERRPDVSTEHLEALVDIARTQVERLHLGLQILLDATAQGSAVVVFEDLHWADSESIALFERIADLDGDRLLVGTYRPAEVTRRNPVAGLLDRLERRHAVFHVRLERLDLPETSALLAAATGEVPPYRAAVALHKRTGGNPFFLEELLRAHDGAITDLDRLGERPLPWSLAEALRRQVEHLDPAHQRLVEAAAVLGYRVPFDLLASVTAWNEHDLIQALRDLVTQGVLVETGEDEFAFRHALVREAIGERLLGRERRRLNEAALSALSASGDADWALIARHARGAGRYDDMLEAARKGSAGYLAIGSAFPALQLAEMGLEEVCDDAGLLATAARAAWLAGLLDDADFYARRWHAAEQAPDGAVDALCLRVRLAWEAQDLDLMTTLSDELHTAQENLPSGRGRAAAMAALAQSARLRDLDDEALMWAERAVNLSEQLGGLAGIRLAALTEKGSTLAYRAEHIEKARMLLNDVADEAEKEGEWFLAAFALNKLVHLPSPGSVQELAELLERMRTDAERAGSEHLAVAAYYQGKARLSMQAGDLAKAVSAIERGRAHDLGYRRTATRSDLHGVFLAGLLLESTGKTAVAAAVIADLTNVPGMHVALPGLRFHLACRQGERDRARDMLPELIAVVRSTGGRDGEFLHDIVSAALAAPLSVAEVAALTEELDGPAVDVAYRELVAAQLAEAREQWPAALARYLNAITSGTLPPAALGAAHVGAARVLIASHRVNEAKPHALAASESLRRWSGWRVEQLDAVRSRLGLRAAVSSTIDAGAGVDALTPREREVAALLAHGLTNAELATRLYISPRTAAVHVSNILRKLGVTSRTEVGAALSA